MTLQQADLVAEAQAESATAASLAKVSMRELHESREMITASEVLSRVWKLEPPKVHISPGVITALAHAGNYVVGAYRGDQMVGACIGFMGQPIGEMLHSHIAGVLPGLAGSGIGKAIKLHQRAWCLQRGLSTISWTFDPLVARNAYFNIHSLGAVASEYLIDFYGSMSDGINRGQPSDRMLVTWNLQSVPEPRPDEGLPQEVLMASPSGGAIRLPQPTGDDAAVGIPTDIERLRESNLALAVRWRIDLRDALVTLLSRGWYIHDFSRDGHYLLRKDH